MTQLKHIELVSLNLILGKTGIDNKTLRLIVFGPKALAGHGFRALEYEQGILQIKLAIQYLCIGGQEGDILFMALQWAQYTSGMRTSILEFSVVYNHMETKWILCPQILLVK